MKTNESNTKASESTYTLLVRSEEKVRSLFETIAYSLFLVSSVAAIWQFAVQPVKLPDTLRTASVAQTAVVSRS